MRSQELRDQVISPNRLTPFQDEVAWGDLVDRLIAAVRAEERSHAATMLHRLSTSARALSSVDSVARLIDGIATRDYAEVVLTPNPGPGAV